MLPLPFDLADFPSNASHEPFCPTVLNVLPVLLRNGRYSFYRGR